MNPSSPSIDEIFLAAIEKDSPEDVENYLAEVCITAELRVRVQRLLQAHRQAADSFLKSPASGLPGRPAIVPDQVVDVKPESLEAGLAATFGPETAVIIGGAGHSVLKSLGKKLTVVPNITLHDSHEDRGRIVQPGSPELRGKPDDSRYHLMGEIARGGMGAIIKGRDTDLGRDIAIKVLLDSHKDKPELIQRFVEEAQIGGQLQHPGIVPVYELGQFGDQRPFFSMKLVKGQTFAALLAKREKPSEGWPKLLGIFEQICQAMAYAHSKGVIHRDLKPANIMVGAFGEVQVMDWGLSKVLRQGGIADEQKSLDKHRNVSVIQTRRSVGSDGPGEVGSDTQMGSAMGTPAYMPPEQALGEIDRLDARADVFGLGAILAEILTGQPPYVGKSGTDTFRLASRGKLEDCHTRLEASGADPQLIALAKTALSPEPEDRMRDAGELAEAVSKYLEGVQERLKQAELARVESNARTQEERRRRKLQVAIAGLALLVMFSVAIVIFQLGSLRTESLKGQLAESRNVELESKAARERAARQNLTLIASLRDNQQFVAALQLAQAALQEIPGDEGLLKLIDEISDVVIIESVPPGAVVRMQPVGQENAEWIELGRTPINAALPNGNFVIEITKEGYRDVHGVRQMPVDSTFKLHWFDEIPPGMVWVPPSTPGFVLTGIGRGTIPMEEFFIDEFEVTNEEYARFIQAGGYEREEYWTNGFEKEGVPVDWQTAIANFCDLSGQPGPSTWTAGKYPEDQSAYPVRGISWYEADAYANFVGKQLPTIFHWHWAVSKGTNLLGAIVPHSNISNLRRGSTAVGFENSTGPYGTRDMIGNVKEWCWNANADGRRYCMGGSWQEQDYMGTSPDLRSALDRPLDVGFRCMKLQSTAPLNPDLLKPINTFLRDYRQETPCSSDQFTEYLKYFHYEASDLNSQVVETKPRGNSIVEKIQFDTAYRGDDKMIAYLYLPDPKRYSPPYQTVLYFHGSYSNRSPIYDGEGTVFDPILNSGRAVILPIYWGTYQRNQGRLKSGYPELSSQWQTATINISQDFSRSVDYLMTREDIDSQRLAFVGYSWGAALCPILLAVDQRCKAAVMICGGYAPTETFAQVDAINFVPRVTAATLMLNGVFDDVFPLEYSQRPMFSHFKLPEEKLKRREFPSSGHNLPPSTVNLETDEWLNLHLGEPHKF